MSPGHAAPTKHAARDPFLEEVEHRSFLFFWKEANPRTGLIKDRAKNFEPDNYEVASIASTGFGLAALPIGVEHGWVTRAAAHQRAMNTLRFFDTKLGRRHGLWPHFIKPATGERVWDSEYSSIDTALFLAGALTSGQYFGGDVKALADRLYASVPWNYWRPRHLICHGSRPEQGEFLPYDYGDYSEALLLYVLAIGSPTHPVPATLWNDIGRKTGRYGGISSIAGPPLFVNQYPNLWVDFAGKHDRFADYVENLRANTLANRQFCIDNAAKYPGLGPNVWGLTASDGPDGYKVYAAPPGTWSSIDGTVSPHAPGGSYAATPALSRAALTTMYKQYGTRIWGRYGFSDAFNPSRNWYDTDVIGIDTGATLLAIEDARSGLVQRLFMSHPAVKNAMKRIGFRPNHPVQTALNVGPEVKAGSPSVFRFNVPAKMLKTWAGQPVALYGGVAVGNVIVTVNGIRYSIEVSTDNPATRALSIPASSLKTSGNTVQIQFTAEAKSGTFGPFLLGPLDSLNYKPLAISALN